MQIKKSVYKQMMRSFSPAPPERGGMIGMENGTICAYMHDDSKPMENRAKYKPNVAEMNRVLIKWKRKGVLFAGLVHSHPAGQDSLSQGDIRYMEKLFACLPEEISCLYFPLVLPDEVICFQIRRLGEKLLIEKQPIEII